MSLAPYRESIVDVPTLPQQTEEFSPDNFTFTSVKECLHIPDHDKGIAGPGQENIQPLWCTHESNIVGGITPGHADQDDLTLFPLIVICSD
jgi:hypothetical protein